MVAALLITECYAQGEFYKYQDVPIIESGDTLLSPWVGGFNNPQFSAADLNNDGIDDLVIFDRSGGKIMTYLNGGTPNMVDYHYSPQFEDYFPADIEHWTLLRDYNCDGVPDLLNGFPGKVNLYLGYYNSDDILEFEFQEFLKYIGFSGTPNIFVSASDIPAIDDVNGDGDLDILTFDFVTGVKIDYYENMSMEYTGTCGDTLIFMHAYDCWGKIVEFGLSREVSIDSNCGTLLTGGGGNHRSAHAGSTLSLFDEDDDGDKELVMGNILFSSLNRLLNGGDTSSAYITHQDTFFPSYDVSVDIPLFASSFFVDINNDNHNDFIASTNAPLISENHTNAWYYRNLQNPGNVKFSFQQDDFLVEDMVDLGEGAYPVFHDYNNDSIYDLVVGNYGYYNTLGGHDASLTLYENVGTNDQPVFQLSTNNFANTATLGLNNLTPAFGDLDGDGDLDMLIGEEQGYVHFFQNNPIGGIDNFVLAFPQYHGIDVGLVSTPQIVDVDGDGVLDLLIGERDGRVNFYRNIGTINQDTFSSTPDNSQFGKIDARKPGLLTGFAAPFLTSLDTTGTQYVLCGTETGKLQLYVVNQDSLYSGTFIKVSDQFSGIDEGGRISPFAKDINSDGLVELLIGNYRGGMNFYTQDSLLVLPAECSEIGQVWADPVTPHSARLNWSPVTFGDHYIIRGRRLGVSAFTHVQIPNGSPSYKDVYGLSDGFSYEWQIMAWCDVAETDSSGWSVMDTFTTDCYTPDTTWTNPVLSNAARLNWTPVTGAAAYEISGRKVGVVPWSSILVSNATSFKDVYGLAANSSYEWTIRTWCDQPGNNRSDFAQLDTFMTASSNKYAAEENEPGSLNFSLFPNPASYKFSLHFGFAEFHELQVSIFSVDGQKVKEEVWSGNTTVTIDISAFNSGIYLVRCSSENGQLGIRKLMVR